MGIAGSGRYFEGALICSIRLLTGLFNGAGLSRCWRIGLND